MMETSEVTQISARAPGSGAGPAWGDLPHLLRECGEISGLRLSSGLSDALRQTVDQLFKEAGEALTPHEREIAIDAAEFARHHRQGIVYDFMRHFETRYLRACLRKSSYLMGHFIDFDVKELKVVEHHVLDDSLDPGQIAEAVRNACWKTLQTLTVQFRDMLGDQELLPNDIPLGPKVVEAAVSDALRDQPWRHKAKQRLAHALRWPLAARVNLLYRDLADHLSARDLKAFTMVTVENDTTKPAEATATANGTTAPGTATQATTAAAAPAPTQAAPTSAAPTNTASANAAVANTQNNTPKAMPSQPVLSTPPKAVQAATPPKEATAPVQPAPQAPQTLQAVPQASAPMQSQPTEDEEDQEDEAFADPQAAAEADASTAAWDEVVRCLEDPNLPRIVSDFLSNHWRRLLTVIHTRFGPDSAAWRDAVRTMDEMAWSLAPKTSHEDRVRLNDGMPYLLQNLNSGMDALGLTLDVRMPLVAYLSQRHAEVLGFAELSAPQVQPAPLPVTPAPVPQQVLHEPPQSTRPAAEPQASQVTAPPQEAALPEVDINEFKVGNWLEFRESDGAIKELKLAWISPRKGLFLLTNRQGERALSLTAANLTELLRDGRARLSQVPGEAQKDKASNPNNAGMKTA